MSVDIPYGIRARIAAIAREYPAVRYDAQDPHRHHIENAAAAAGILAIADDTVTPRTIRGAVAPTDSDLRDVRTLAACLHEFACLPQGAGPTVCDEDTVMAGAMVESLAQRGARISFDRTGSFRP